MVKQEHVNKYSSIVQCYVYITCIIMYCNVDDINSRYLVPSCVWHIHKCQEVLMYYLCIPVVCST